MSGDRFGQAAKANLVAALKAMARDVTHGEAVSVILDASPVWAAYRDQRHDLFLTSTAVAGYLTGPTAQVAGYLMVRLFVGFFGLCFVSPWSVEPGH